MTEWERLVEWFTGAYGAPPDFEDKLDQHLFLELVRQELRDEIEKPIIAAANRAAERIRAIDLESSRVM